jgi:hypothetical protein
MRLPRAEPSPPGRIIIIAAVHLTYLHNQLPLRQPYLRVKQLWYPLSLFFTHITFLPTESTRDSTVATCYWRVSRTRLNTRKLEGDERIVRMSQDNILVRTVTGFSYLLEDAGLGMSENCCTRPTTGRSAVS